MVDAKLRQQLIDIAGSLFNRGYSCGGAGNISVLQDDGTLLATPTNSSLGALDAETLSHIAADGTQLSGLPPSKELFLHQAIYQVRPECRAVVHLHSHWLTALSCMPDLDSDSCLPPITPYFVMRVGKLPLAPYLPPGDPRLADEMLRLAPTHSAILLANHGVVVSGRSLQEAVFNVEELEATARLFLTLLLLGYKTLSEADIQLLQQRFPRN